MLQTRPRAWPSCARAARPRRRACRRTGSPRPRRDRPGGEQGKPRGDALEAAVGVPEPVAQRVEPQTVILGADPVLVVEVGDVGDVDVEPRDEVGAVGSDGGFQIAEAAAKRHLLFVGDGLPGKTRTADLLMASLSAAMVASSAARAGPDR